MTPRSKKFEIAIFVTTLAVIAAFWVLNGLEDTWLYISAIVITMPASWYLFGKRNKDR